MRQLIMSRVKRKLRTLMSPSATVTPLTSAAHENEVYRGYDATDVARTGRFSDLSLPTKQGYVTDFFGIRTSVAVLPYVAHLSGHRVEALPFPDDSVHADGIEYAALTMAVERSKGQRFTAMELGAGWGPWLAASGTLAKRRGATDVQLVGVEADPGRYQFMLEHLQENDLRPHSADPMTTADGVMCDLRLGAAWWENTTLFFPVVDSANDHGGAVSPTRTPEDYRGLKLDQREVRAWSVPELLEQYNPIDFLHVDIQGSEGELIEKCVEPLTKRVRHMFVGTHSRKIEGDLIDLLSRHGWQLLNEKPCRFDPSLDRPTLPGKTTRDGAQFWINVEFAGA